MSSLQINMLGRWVLMQEVKAGSTSAGGILLGTRDKTEPDMGRVFCAGSDAVGQVHPHDLVLLEAKAKRYPVNLDRDLPMPMPGLFVVDVNDVAVVLDSAGVNIQLGER